MTNGGYDPWSHQSEQAAISHSGADSRPCGRSLPVTLTVVGVRRRPPETACDAGFASRRPRARSADRSIHRRAVPEGQPDSR